MRGNSMITGNFPLQDTNYKFCFVNYGNKQYTFQIQEWTEMPPWHQFFDMVAKAAGL